MTAHQVNEAGRAQALRGDDALARAAGDIAAPRRRLLAGLRDAHAEACARIARLRGQQDALPARLRGQQDALPARLLAEAEEQLRRIELLLALLRERPRPSGPRDPAPATTATLAAEERAGAAEARRLRDMATLAEQHLAARLLDLTAEERDATARLMEARLH
ncbi:hypothetical protein [Falsiroseomonas sp. HW251]|uniref:hypothetical protein n=1 Tax=Falsiroseomonas sp. HW251 TaxID=3390998 RepID=UPI003D313D9E